MQTIERLRERLERAGLTVERDGDALEIAAPYGRDEAARRVEPGEFVERLPDSREESERDLAAYAAGIRYVLLEPADSDAGDWEFTEAAGRLGVSLQAQPFREGTAAAGDSPAWIHPLVDDLVFAFLIELDRGVRVLTDDQFERWSATSDRLISGGRSMLFHKAQQTNPRTLENYDRVEYLEIGDGYDAARSLVLDDLLFGEFDETSRLAMPTANDLYFVRDGTREAVDQLRSAVDERVDDAEYPLTRRLFRFERGRPTPAD